MTKTVNIMTDAARGASPDGGTASDATGLLAERIAGNVAAGRRRLGLSQDQLAVRSGASKGTIVQIEQGLANPSISSLCRIAVALGVSVEDLVSAPSRACAHIQVVARSKLLWQGSGGGSARLHVGTRGPNMLELWSWELAPGESYHSEGHSPGTREIVMVLKGALQVTIGDEVAEITAGSSATFEAGRAHSYTGKARGMTAFTMVVEDPGSPVPV